ncbi:single-stranded DNA-binding protein [Bengtsoniella intestinalis]|uniref:single-stranded DNA-binding protein n=1 Tax=Bengtsoniella intestinalis TaxID=3073143 RepID=UPI00391F6570
MSNFTGVNQLQLEGQVACAPVFSHQNHQTNFHRLLLEVPRLSGYGDVLPVLLPSSLAEGVAEGDRLRLHGQLRSFNNKSGEGNRLVLSLYTQTLLPVTGSPSNHIALCGALCKPPILRRTPLGRSICDLMLAVPRLYGRADYIPAIAWGELALRTGALDVGAVVSLEGRMQSRDYQKQEGALMVKHIAYEVSVMKMIR